MNNENVNTKKKIGGIVLDIITIGLLFAAFGMVFYAGFITEEEDLTLNIMSAVTAVGLILLFLIGTFSCLITKVKTKSLTAGFLALAALQLYALLSNLVVLGCLLINLYTVEDMFMRVSYLVTTAIILIGYVINIISFSDNNIPNDESEDDSNSEEDETMEDDTDSADEEIQEDEEVSDKEDTEDITEE